MYYFADIFTQAVKQGMRVDLCSNLMAIDPTEDNYGYNLVDYVLDYG